MASPKFHVPYSGGCLDLDFVDPYLEKELFVRYTIHSWLLQFLAIINCCSLRGLDKSEEETSGLLTPSGQTIHKAISITANVSFCEILCYLLKAKVENFEMYFESQILRGYLFGVRTFHPKDTSWPKDLAWIGHVMTSFSWMLTHRSRICKLVFVKINAVLSWLKFRSFLATSFPNLHQFSSGANTSESFLEIGDENGKSSEALKRDRFLKNCPYDWAENSAVYSASCNASNGIEITRGSSTTESVTLNFSGLFKKPNLDFESSPAHAAMFFQGFYWFLGLEKKFWEYYWWRFFSIHYRFSKTALTILTKLGM